MSESRAPVRTAEPPKGTTLFPLGAQRRSGAQWFLRNAARAEVNASQRGYQVYEYYSRSGEPLYIGKSGGEGGKKPDTWVDRGWTHIEENPAIAEADRIVVHAELTFPEAFALEEALIGQLKPRFNVAEGEFTRRYQHEGTSHAANVQSASRRPTYTFRTDIIPPTG